MILEVIVQSVADAVASDVGGADRLELVRSIEDGGLTPSVELVRAIARETSLPLRVMVRENAGYELGLGELPRLRRAALEFADAGVDGIVIGFARAGEPRLDDVERVLEAAPGVRVTFHRAFDVLKNPFSCLTALAAIAQVDRVLTDGGGGTPHERRDRLRDYTAKANGTLTIIAGGGVTEEAISLFARSACVREVHVGRAARDGNVSDGPVSAARVRRLRALADLKSG